MTDTPSPEALALIEELRRAVVIPIGSEASVAIALDLFAAARVEAERESCLLAIKPHRKVAQEARHNQYSDARTKQQWAVVAHILEEIEQRIRSEGRP